MFPTTVIKLLACPISMLTGDSPHGASSDIDYGTYATIPYPILSDIFVMAGNNDTRLVCKDWNAAYPPTKTINSYFDYIKGREDARVADGLVMAVKTGMPMEKCTFAAATKVGDVRILTWLFDNGCKPCEHVCAGLAARGHLAAFQWARANNLPWDDWTLRGAAMQGNLDVIIWAVENGCPWGRTCIEAARGGHLEVLKWARANGCPWDSNTCSAAAVHGHLGVIEWARQNGCPWGTGTCRNAAAGGHLDVIIWARENGCPWDERLTSSFAAVYGHLSIIEWALADGCPWDLNTCAVAAGRGHIEILKWARAKGYPWDEERCVETARQSGDERVVDWVRRECGRAKVRHAPGQL